MLVAAVLQLVIGALVLSAIGTVIVTPILKMTVRDLGWGQIAKLCFWAFARGMMAITALYFTNIVILRKPAHETPALAILAILVLVGWLIKTDLKLARTRSMSAP